MKVETEEIPPPPKGTNPQQTGWQSIDPSRQDLDLGVDVQAKYSNKHTRNTRS